MYILDNVHSTTKKCEFIYSGNSLLRSPKGLGKIDLNTEVTVLPKLTLYSFFTMGNHLGLSKSDRNRQVTVLGRGP